MTGPTLTATVGLLLACLSSSRADIVYTFSGGNQSSPTSTYNTYGFEFTPVVDVTVDSLGYFDADTNGLNGGHRVGIWNLSETLLASTTVSNLTGTYAGPTINGGRYLFTSIAGVQLLAGTRYVFGAAYENLLDPLPFGGTPISAAPTLVTIETTPGGRVVGGSAASGFNFPTNTTGNTFHLGSFTAFQTPAAPAAVPEPSALWLMGAGLVALAVGVVGNTDTLTNAAGLNHTGPKPQNPLRG